MSTATLSETVSEKALKQNRGRPRLLSARSQQRLANQFVNVRTNRSLHNIEYRMRAVSAIFDDTEFAWLWNPPAFHAGQARAWKPLILTELGRIEDHDQLRSIAREICRLKPKTHDAVRMIRRYRLGRLPAGDTWGLTSAITLAIDKYLATHEGTTWQMVQGALEESADACQEMEATESEVPA